MLITRARCLYVMLITRVLADQEATGELRALNKAGNKGGALAEVLGDAEPSAWKDFLACMACLGDFGYVRGEAGGTGEANVTDVGRMIASINADNPLWVGSVLLYSEELYDFGPHELAAALSCVVSDLSRPDIYVAVEASDKVRNTTLNPKP
jgi:superfamily II RNA helicase